MNKCKFEKLLVSEFCKKAIDQIFKTLIVDVVDVVALKYIVLLHFSWNWSAYCMK